MLRTHTYVRTHETHVDHGLARRVGRVNTLQYTAPTYTHSDTYNTTSACVITICCTYTKYSTHRYNRHVGHDLARRVGHANHSVTLTTVVGTALSTLPLSHTVSQSHTQLHGTAGSGAGWPPLLKSSA